MRYNYEEIDSLGLQGSIFDEPRYIFVPLEAKEDQKRRKTFPVKSLPLKYRRFLSERGKAPVLHKRKMKGGEVVTVGLLGHLELCNMSRWR